MSKEQNGVGESVNRHPTLEHENSLSERDRDSLPESDCRVENVSPLFGLLDKPSSGVNKETERFQYIGLIYKLKYT